MERGQVLTLEAVLAAIVVIAGLVFALQAVVATPTTGDRATAPVDAAHLDSFLEERAADGQAKEALLFWDSRGEGFHGSDGGGGTTFRYYTRDKYDDEDNGPGTSTIDPEFLRSLNRSFDRTVAMNVILRYRKPDETTGTQRMVDQGAPGAGAVRASTTVVLYDDDELRNSDGDRTGRTVEAVATTSSREFYAPDASPETDLFNVVEVEVVVWQQ